MRICFVVTGFPPETIGGTETQTYNLARNLAKKHDVIVLTRRLKGLEKISKKDGFTIRRFRYINFPVVRFLSHVLSCSWNLGKMKNDIDVAFCMMLSPNGISGVVAKKLFGIRSVASIRGGDWFEEKKGILERFIIGLVVRNSDTIVAQTDIIKNGVKDRYPHSKVDVIPNGVDITGEKASGDRIIFLGNIQKRKGVDVLLRSMHHVDAELSIGGDGKDRPELEKLSRSLGVDKKVRFVGKIKPEKVREFLKRGRIFVLPSLIGEGLPNVILEAMSVGLPVVSTRISGIPDVVKDGKTGILVDPGDTDGLAKAINKILTNGKTHSEMSRNCLSEVKNYSWEKTVKRIERITAEV